MTGQRHIDGFTVRTWDEQTSSHTPADLVIEAFGCRMPETQIQAMARMSRPPAWINLEYLSAEAWVSDHHGLPSPHPSWPLRRYFFFPGFDAGSGGLIREPHLQIERQTFEADARNDFLARIGVVLRPDERLISMFCYPAAPLTECWNQLRNGPPVLCVLPGMGECSTVPADEGQLRVRSLPFLEPDDYDRLLWSADLNFVRGEDSAVRAQWAGRPFVWQLYPQAADAHHVKCEAFLARYLEEVDASLAQQIAQIWHWWNRRDGALPDGLSLPSILSAWSRHADAWASQLYAQADLTSRLLGFARKIG